MVFDFSLSLKNSSPSTPWIFLQRLTKWLRVYLPCTVGEAFFISFCFVCCERAYTYFDSTLCFSSFNRSFVSLSNVNSYLCNWSSVFSMAMKNSSAILFPYLNASNDIFSFMFISLRLGIVIAWYFGMCYLIKLWIPLRSIYFSS